MQISLGWHHMLALDTLEGVWAWGSNRYGQRGCQHPQIASTSATVVHKPSHHDQASSYSSCSASPDTSPPSKAAAAQVTQQDLVFRASCARGALGNMSAHAEHHQPSTQSNEGHHESSVPSWNHDAALGAAGYGAASSSKDASILSSSMSEAQDLKASKQLGHQRSSTAGDCSSQGRQVAEATASCQQPESDGASTPDRGPACEHPGNGWHQSECLAPVQGLLNVPCQAIAAGSEHSLAVTKHGQVFAWGWGEHGQLGLGHQHDVCCPSQIKALPPMQGCAAGCGFSFAF